jgi:hypothetical protein
MESADSNTEAMHVRELEDDRRMRAHRTQEELSEPSAQPADKEFTQKVFGLMLDMLQTQRLDDYNKVLLCCRPGDFGDGVYVGSAKHATEVHALQQLGIKAVINCAPRACKDPEDAYAAAGIKYYEVRCVPCALDIVWRVCKTGFGCRLTHTIATSTRS